jgi:hypothetical protein
MAVGITVTRDDVETLFVQVALSGLTAGQKFDVLRVQYRYLGKNDAGVRQYQRELPDRRALWSSVAHRMGWTAPATTATFRDYEAPMRPVKYFVCPSSLGGPHEWDFHDGKYPISRGALSSTTIHFNQDLAEADLGLEPQEGDILVRSTDELALYTAACLVEMDGPKFVARGTEHAVLGSQYPTYIADTRESRRGSVTLLARNLGEYLDLQRIVFPASGRIRPVMLMGGGDRTLLLDDLRCLPMDVSAEQATQSDPDLRYIRIDYIEIDPNNPPLVARSGDNDSMVTPPIAQFSISDDTPARGAWVTLTNTSTGLWDEAEWTVQGPMDNRVGKSFETGPLKVRWSTPGVKQIKLRVYGSGAGAHTRTKTVRVH